MYVGKLNADEMPGKTRVYHTIDRLTVWITDDREVWVSFDQTDVPADYTPYPLLRVPDRMATAC